MGPLASIDRRLLIAAALLLAAIAAIPFLLKADPAAPPAPVPAAGAKQGSAAEATLATTAVVTPAEAADRKGRRQVLGTPKDPFRPTRPKVREAKAAQASAAKAPATSSAPAAGPSTPTTSTSTPATTTPTTAPTPKVDKQSPKYYAIDVRLTQHDKQRTKRDIPRLTALPSNSAPFLVYLGLLEDHQTVVFLVSSDVKVLTDGSCKPSTTQCERVHLKEGEIMYFEARHHGQVLQYELELLRIDERKSDGAAKAAAAKARQKGAGKAAVARAAHAAAVSQERNRRFARWLVKLQRDRLDGIRYDAKTGVLRYPKR